MPACSRKCLVCLQLLSRYSTGASGPVRLCSRIQTTWTESAARRNNGGKILAWIILRHAAVGKSSQDGTSQGRLCCMHSVMPTFLFFSVRCMNGIILYSQSTQRYNTSSSMNPRPQRNFSTPGRMTSGSYSFQKSKENFQTAPSTSSKQHYHTSATNPQTMLSHSSGSRAQSSYPRRAEHSQPSTNSWRPGGFSPYFPSNKGPSNQPLHAYQPSVSHSARSFSHTERPQASFPPGRAVEPAPHHVSQPAPLIRSVINHARPLYPDSDTECKNGALALACACVHAKIKSPSSCTHRHSQRPGPLEQVQGTDPNAL